jgi:hypothetical protein
MAGVIPVQICCLPRSPHEPLHLFCSYTNPPDAIDTLCYIPQGKGRSKNGWADLWADPSGFWGFLANLGLRKSLKENGNLVRRVGIEPTT